MRVQAMGLRGILPIRPRRRTLIAAVVVLSQLVAATGLPLPVLAHASRDHSTPYPCMGRSCCCGSAEECWRSCRCFTARERLAWAEERGIDVPDYLREAAAREAPTQEAGCSRCKAKHDHATEKATNAGVKIRFVLGIQAQRCGGHDSLALSTQPPALPAMLPDRRMQTPEPAGAVIPILPSLDSISEGPAEPPPR